MARDLLIGIDESNNGKSFEIHTAVFSLIPTNAVLKARRPIFPKIRKHKNLFNRLRKRTYSFLLFTDSDRVRIPRIERTGAIVTSLLSGEYDYSEFDSLNFFLDGERKQQELDYLVEQLTEEIPGIDSSRVGISYGGQFDQKHLVVNIADQLAHYLFRKGIDYVSEHKDRKALLY